LFAGEFAADGVYFYFIIDEIKNNRLKNGIRQIFVLLRGPNRGWYIYNDYCLCVFFNVIVVMATLY